MLHLATTKRPITLLVTATALKPTGEKAASFAATMDAPPVRQQRDLPKMARRFYRVPAGFGDGQEPTEYLKKNGITFPQQAVALLEDGKLTVINTMENLELIEGLLTSVWNVERKTNKQIFVVVQMVKLKKEWSTLQNEWFPFPLGSNTEDKPAEQLPPLRNEYFFGGILTDPQLQVIVRNLVKNDGLKPLVLGRGMVANGKESTFDVPAALGGHQLTVTPSIDSDRTIELQMQASNSGNAAVHGATTTAATILDGQTVILAGQPAEKEKTTRCLFITTKLIAPTGIPAKK